MKYDIAIIGGGPAGYTAGERAAENGLKTILFVPARRAVHDCERLQPHERGLQGRGAATGRGRPDG